MLPGNLRELEDIRKECLRMSGRRALLSAAATIIPFPFSDVLADVVLLRTVIPQITERFGLARDQVDRYDPQVAVLIYDMVKKLGAGLIGRYVTKELVLQVLKVIGLRRLTARQAARCVPIAGQALAAGLSYGAMTFIIRLHINHCYRIAQAAMHGPGIEGQSP
jgi:uncharacterized protein (DUF697 family)